MSKLKSILAILIATLVVGVIFYSKHHQSHTDQIQIAGIVEAPEVNVSSIIPGRIMKMTCREGDAVEKGVRLIELDNDELKAVEGQAQAQVEKAKADILVAKAAVENARANIDGIKAETRNAQAVYDKSKILLVNAGREKDRYTALSKEQVVAGSAYDNVTTAYQAAQAECEAAKARLAQQSAKKNAALAQKETAESQYEAAKANLKQTEAGLALAKARFAQSIITSPISGTIVYKALQEGEAVSAGMTILTIVNMKDLTVRLDVEETHVADLPVGQDVMIVPSGDNRKMFQGKIVSVIPYAEFATQKDVTRGRQDIKTFKVTVRVDDSGGVLKPGMTVDVKLPSKKAS